jgi:signal transduction histidine kinase/ActR/RegA family two-component response regulator
MNSSGVLGGRQLCAGLLAVVVIALVGAAIAGSVVVDRVVRDQERSLLRERAGEVAALLTAAVTDTESSLPVLAEVSRLQNGSRAVFARAARSILANGVLSVGVIRLRNGVFTVRSAAGRGLGVSQRVSGQRVALARRALRESGPVTTILHEGTTTLLDLAIAGLGGAVVYEELPFQPSRPIPTPPGSPLRGVNIALYASARAQPSTLVLTGNGRTPSSGLIDRRVIAVGTDPWLLLTSAREPLVGTFASDLHWWVLGFGLLAALLTGSLFTVLYRRRRYALRSVSAATTDLRAALEQHSRAEREAHEARAAAAAASEAKSEFLSQMSHELRTPLHAILGFGQLLEMDDLPSEQGKSVDQILKAGRHLLSLIEEVLDISLVEAGAMGLSLEPVDMVSAFSDVAELIAPVADSAGIRIISELDIGSEVFVLADRQRLRQVILNLLSNAVKYNLPGGAVTLSLDSDADRVRITVADTGPGIEPDDLERLFVPFDRLGAEQGGVPGTGLGLALSKSLVELMDGTISVHSSPSEGSSFTVELTAAPNPVTADSLSRAREAGRHALGIGAQTILYIEDNPSNAALVEQTFASQPDVRLVTAIQGGTGLELAAAHRPDLILLDLNLPDIHGSVVLERLQADPDTAEIPVIVLSADATQGQIRSLLNTGARSHLTKPLDIPQFLDQVLKHLSSEVGSL